MGSLWSTRVVRRPGRTVLEHWDVRHRIIQHGHGAHCVKDCEVLCLPCHKHETTRHQGQKETTHPQKGWCLPATSTNTTRHQERNTRMNVPQALYKIIIVILLIVCLLLLLSILFSHYGSTIPAEDKLWIRKCARPKKKENNWTHASFMMFWISGTGGNPCKGFLGLKVVDFPTKSFWFSA